jgi:cell division protein YceG involved in septum cleavage
MKRIVVVIALVVAGGLFVAAGVGWYAWRVLSLPAASEEIAATGDDEFSEEVVFEILPGDTLRGVTRRLEAYGLVSDARVLEVYARFSDYAQRLQAGRYCP